MRGPATYQGARCASRSISVLHGQNRCAFDAEFASSALGVVRDELVFGVVLKLHETKPRAFDFFSVRVLLVCAADARRPQSRVAHDAFGELLLGNDVRYREATAPLEEASGFAKHLGLVRREVDDAVRDDTVEGARLATCLFNVALLVSDVREPASFAEALGFRELLVGHVDTHDAT